MDWDQLATISQLMTGAAMLAVSVFLATQLRIQRQDSERAHNDSERDFAFFNENRQPKRWVHTAANSPLKQTPLRAHIGSFVSSF